MWPQGAPKRVPRKKRASKALILACCGIAVAILLAVALLPRSAGTQDGKRPSRKRQPKTIKEVKPAVPAAAAPQPDSNTVVEAWSLENDKVSRDANKKIIYNPDAPLGSKANPINIDAMKFPDNPIQPKRKLFGTHAENYICALMRTKPGTRVIQSRLPANFDDEFKAHIADPVDITDEDTDEDIELKKQMHEFKKAAAALIGEGMTPTEIILQERRELNKIADHRAVCAAEIGRLKREGASEQDIEDCVNAANAVMEQYGARKFMTDSQIKKLLFEKKSSKEAQ